MNMMMNQFQRMSVIQNPFGGGQTSEISQQPSTQDLQQVEVQLKNKISELEEQNKDLLQTNSTMSKQILSLQQKTEDFESKIATFKKYKWMLHHAAGIQCMQCYNLFTREDFSAHL